MKNIIFSSRTPVDQFIPSLECELVLMITANPRLMSSEFRLWALEFPVALVMLIKELKPRPTE